MPDDDAAPPAPPNQLWELLRFFLLLALAAFCLRAFVFASFSIPTGSMLPRLMVGDYLFVSKWNYGYSRYSLPFHLPLIDGRVLASVPERGDIITVAFAVVAFSIFVQGLTMEPLMRRLGLIRVPAAADVPGEAETRPA